MFEKTWLSTPAYFSRKEVFMLSKQQAQELSERSYLIHTQILTEHGNVLNHPHHLALQAIHQTLAGMVCGESSEWHGRWGLSAPVGFGKSSAIASFISAAWQLGFLGNGVTMTLTASRVAQLFDFENAIINAGIPKAEIRKWVSVVYFTPRKAIEGAPREADTDYNAPILLVSHNKIRQVYRPKEHWGYRQKDLVYFLKAHDEPRDLVIWDERCSTTEPLCLSLDELRQAIFGFKGWSRGTDEQVDFIRWVGQIYARLKEAADKANETNQAVLLEGLVETGQLTAKFKMLQHTPSLLRNTRDILYLLIDLLKFPLRILPGGFVSYRVVVPDCITNLLVLDASFEQSALTQMDQTIQNLEDVHPLLVRIHTVYKKRLKDLKDCSDLTFYHWNKGSGKTRVEEAAQAYLDGTAEEGNLIHEVVKWLKPRVEAGKAILICTHKTGENVKDLGDLARRCFTKAFDFTRTVPDPFNMVTEIVGEQASLRNSQAIKKPSLKPQITLETYGKLDASNEFAYCSVLVHLGIQERTDFDIGANIVSQRRDLKASFTDKERDHAKLCEKAVVFQQSNGRGQSRIVSDGKALPQETLAIYYDTKSESLTDLLKPMYWGATWIEYNKKAPVKKEGVIATWVETVKTKLNDLPQEQWEISSRALKVLVGAQEIPAGTWRHITQAVDEDKSCSWQLRGRSFVHYGRFMAREAA